MIAQHILVPTDFSECATQAVDYAIEMAKAHRSRLTLLHVIDIASWADGREEAMLPRAYWQELETGVTDNMAAPRNRVQAAELPVETLIIHGKPFQTIIDTAKDKGADLIIMGTHGRTGLTHAMLGSVAERVVRLAPCPVLVTRDTATTATA